MTTIRFDFDEFLARSYLNAEELYRVLDALPNYGCMADLFVRTATNPEAMAELDTEYVD